MRQVIGTITTYDLGDLCPSGTYNIIEVVKDKYNLLYITDEMHEDEDEGMIPFIVSGVLVAKFAPNEFYDKKPHPV